MSMTAIFTAPGVLAALLFFLVVGACEPFVEYRLNRALDGNQAFHWSWAHLLAPFLRAVSIVVFVYLAYPAVFAVRHAPDFALLLADGTLRLNNLVGILFLCTLLLPIIPVFERRVELILPLQALIATAAVFDWYTDYLGASAASIWPGTPTALLLAGVVVFGHRVAADLGNRLGHAMDKAFVTRGFDRVVPNAMELLAQAPVILLYGYALGRQVAI